MSFDAIAAIGGVSGLGGVSGAGGLSGLGGPSGLGPAAGLDGPAGTSGAAATSGADFSGVLGGLGHGFDAVQASQNNADNLAVQAAAGTLTDPSQLTIAATQASLMTSLATTIESKAVQAFNQIMSMQA